MVFVEAAEEKPETTLNKEFSLVLESCGDGLDLFCLLLLVSNYSCLYFGSDSSGTFFFVLSIFSLPSY